MASHQHSQFDTNHPRSLHPISPSRGAAVSRCHRLSVPPSFGVICRLHFAVSSADVIGRRCSPTSSPAFRSRHHLPSSPAIPSFLRRRFGHHGRQHGRHLGQHGHHLANTDIISVNADVISVITDVNLGKTNFFSVIADAASVITDVIPESTDARRSHRSILQPPLVDSFIRSYRLLLFFFSSHLNI